MAQRVGPAGRVTGIDVDAPLGAQALTMLHDAGHRQCRFAPLDITADEPLPGAPFDLVYARLLLYHLPERVTVLRRLWDAVAPGGHLLIQDYDLRSIGVLPTLDSLEELRRVLVEAFTAAGCDVQIGARLPELFAQAGIGAPDGTDVSGRLEPLAEAQPMITAVYTSVLPTAIAHGITTEQRAAATLSEVARDVERFPDRPTLWPLLIGAWKRKPSIRERGSAHRDPCRYENHLATESVLHPCLTPKIGQRLSSRDRQIRVATCRVPVWTIGDALIERIRRSVIGGDVVLDGPFGPRRLALRRLRGLGSRAVVHRGLHPGPRAAAIREHAPGQAGNLFFDSELGARGTGERPSCACCSASRPVESRCGGVSAGVGLDPFCGSLGGAAALGNRVNRIRTAIRTNTEDKVGSRSYRRRGRRSGCAKRKGAEDAGSRSDATRGLDGRSRQDQGVGPELGSRTHWAPQSEAWAQLPRSRSLRGPTGARWRSSAGPTHVVGSAARVLGKATEGLAWGPHREKASVRRFCGWSVEHVAGSRWRSWERGSGPGR